MWLPRRQREELHLLSIGRRALPQAHLRPAARPDRYAIRRRLPVARNMVLPEMVEPVVGVEPTTCCLRNYPSVQTGAIVTSGDRTRMRKAHERSGHVRTEIPALDGMIDNEIDNTLLRANVPTKERTTQSIPLERAERAQDARNDLSRLHAVLGGGPCIRSTRRDQSYGERTPSSA